MKRFFTRVLWILILTIFIALALSLTDYIISRQSQLARLLRQRDHLRQVINRLTGRTRRAELLVDGQVISGTGKVLQTTLLWREFTVGPHGQSVPLPMKKIIIPGHTPFVDGFVLKFQDKYVENGDLLRGKSLAFFRCIYANQQAPDHGTSLYGPDGVPLVFSNKNGHPNTLERRLWSRIATLMRHPRECPKFGLQLVQQQAVSLPVRPGKLYEIYLQNDGGLEFIQKLGGSSLVRQLLQQASLDQNRTLSAP
ncbi:MAG: hypothetical protein HKL95_01030 [Phycisphaerae bacterium]|nr:hypothetical protein [Phycisphaerae bacterium]